MPNNYYDIDDIVTDGQKIPSTFQLSVPNLGYLQGNIGQEVRANSKADLPLWLASSLATQDIPGLPDTAFIEISSPPEFSPKVLNALKTDPINVDVRLLSSVYFKLAERWLSLLDDPELLKILVETVKRRSMEIADMSNNPRGAQENSEFIFKLDETEMKLYKMTQEAVKDMKNWSVGK
ncbi:similar to Saccharomyces cerevisiae YOL146W PSF3 Subunit of the GINS complex [Geotrichum candidum]|uniref:DNA replication complex GINS protein PSF3 n=1 Tax=Geotrichum candidum TaxID=1173061 RepID=A0A0J9XIQ6_GEOCN|nr:similar to Saccharomyces cerevisiae YOL146W PSF3 Subunit of the GINS complex [Geotrichum candidum]